MKRIERLHQKKAKKSFFEATKADKEPRKGRGYFVLILLMLFRAIYLLFLSDIFLIKSVAVNGVVDSEAEEIKNKINSLRGDSLWGQNLILFSAGSSEEALKKEFNFSDIKIRKKFPDELLIDIKKPEIRIIWVTKGERYKIDERGYVFESGADNSVPEVFDILNIPVSVGERVVSPTFINFISGVSSDFKTIVGEDFEKIIIYDVLSDVRIKSKSGWTVYMDSTRDHRKQLENLVMILNEAKNKGKDRLEYIDMRLPNRIFYK